ncbi:universal stress protein [Amphritea pacifica]|uniref:Universal stress protein n=1 Tax=Amphritea pacifica TaxID=2811233 RepID=A0ABS2W481_9GAMM|nr:universal stress protein [Amphritea pacifica]MBN0986515.1 universal stress protein [Amphritea pacifica]
MLLNKRLLLVLDQQDQACNALQRCRLIAGRLQSQVTLIWLGDSIEKAEAAVKQLEGDSISVALHIAARDKLLKLLAKFLERESFGLLIKSCDPRSKGFMTSVDGQILRELPCPVLMVKRDLLWQDGVVMAAVNSLANDSYQRRLNDDVLKVAAQIALATGSTLTAAVACPSAMMGADPVMQSEELIQQKAHQALDAQLSRLQLQPQDVAVGEGPAEYWIPEAAAKQAARLVVIGTRARGGLKGALIGNTAERILPRLDCDILVLRIGLSDQVVPVLQQ